MPFYNLLPCYHGQNDIGDLPRQSLPLVLVLFVTLLQNEDEHLQHLEQAKTKQHGIIS